MGTVSPYSFHPAPSMPTPNGTFPNRNRVCFLHPLPAFAAWLTTCHVLQYSLAGLSAGVPPCPWQRLTQMSPPSASIWPTALWKNCSSNRRAKLIFDLPPTWGKLKIIRRNLLDPNLVPKLVPSTSWSTVTFPKDVSFRRFSEAALSPSREDHGSKEDANRWILCSAKASARHIENEKFPSPTTRMSPLSNSGCNKAI